MVEGSLNDHLSGKAPRMRPLEWKKRLEIAIGAAQGLKYLHECHPIIVHRDVKPDNILLDGNMEAKIADFGLSKIFPGDLHSYVNTVVKGTAGYLDPEYVSTQNLSRGSDVYSFGLVLLQLATGLAVIINVADQRINIADFVSERYEKDAIKDIVDKKLEGKYDINSIQKLVKVGLECASRESRLRPKMSEVLVKLKACLDPSGEASKLQPIIQ